MTPRQIARFRSLIAAYIKRVRTLKHCTPEFVLNEDLFEFAKKDGPLPEVIVVADNPGCKELEKRQFLSGYGKAGPIARRMWLGTFGAKYLRHVLIFNKSNYSTVSTDALGNTMCYLANQQLLKRIREDQTANATLIRELALLLKIPVVTAGREKSDPDIFRSFRDTLEVHYDLSHAVFFRGLMVPASQIVPHFSRYGCFRRMTGDDSWNARIERFLGKYCSIPNIETPKGGISFSTLRARADGDLWFAYFTTVYLGATAKNEDQAETT
jgi:hypothetical protein